MNGVGELSTRQVHRLNKIALVLLVATVLIWVFRQIATHLWVESGEYPELRALVDWGYTIGMLAATPVAFAMLAASLALHFAPSLAVEYAGGPQTRNNHARIVNRTHMAAVMLYTFAVLVDLFGGQPASWLYAEYSILWPTAVFQALVLTVIPYVVLPAATALLAVSLVLRFSSTRRSLTDLGRE